MQKLRKRLDFKAQMRIALIFTLLCILSIVLANFIPKKVLVPSIIITLTSSLVLYIRIICAFLRRRYA